MNFKIQNMNFRAENAKYRKSKRNSRNSQDNNPREFPSYTCTLKAPFRLQRFTKEPKITGVEFKLTRPRVGAARISHILHPFQNYTHFMAHRKTIFLKHRAIAIGLTVKYTHRAMETKSCLLFLFHRSCSSPSILQLRVCPGSRANSTPPFLFQRCW